MQNYGERVRYIRQLFNLSQSDLANILGVHKQVISDVERGRQKRFSMEAETKLVEKLHINPQWLLKGEGEPVIEENKDVQFSNMNTNNQINQLELLSDEERIIIKYFKEIPEEKLFDAFLCLLECIKKFR